MSLNSINSFISVIAPQYATDPRLNDLIEIAKLNTSIKCFGGVNSQKYMYAVSLRVCHDLAMEMVSGSTGDGTDSGSGTGGEISEEKEGKLSRKFQQNSDNSLTMGFDYLNNTIYGKKLIELIRGSCILPITRLVD